MAVLAIVIVLLSAFAGMAIYYSFAANNKKESELQSQIANQNAETARLNSEISTLKTQLANLTGVVSNLTSR
jgi:cell division protein FtsB